MGLGIGKFCDRCQRQLNYEEMFNADETLCYPCESILKYDNKDTSELDIQYEERTSREKAERAEYFRKQHYKKMGWKYTTREGYPYENK